MLINSHSVHFSCEEVFQLIYDHDPKLSEQVDDLLCAVAEQLYLLTPLPGGKYGDSILGDGMQFHAGGVFWSNKDLTPFTKWEEILEQR